MTTELKEVVKIWPKVSRVLSAPRNDREYKRLVRLVDEIIEETRGDETHPLASLAETIGRLIEAYEDETEPDFSGRPIDALNFLMEEHGLRQSDLPELGSQGVVSEVLSGKRQLNIRQVRALSKRFNVSTSVFVD